MKEETNNVFASLGFPEGEAKALLTTCVLMRTISIYDKFYGSQCVPGVDENIIKLIRRGNMMKLINYINDEYLMEDANEQ